jgi:hypothetical protein
MATRKIMNMKNGKRNELININSRKVLWASENWKWKHFDENGTNSGYMRVFESTETETVQESWIHTH